MSQFDPTDPQGRLVNRSRLFLITPRHFELESFVPELQAALDAGDVASLLIATETTSEAALQRIAERLVPLAQAHDVAVLVRGDTRAMGRSQADGLHVDSGLADLTDAVERFQPRSIVGAGNIRTRDEAMAVGEAGADYLFFGLLDLAPEPTAHRKSLDFGRWWAGLFEPPCVVLAGTDLASVGEAAATGAEFVAVREAIWEHSGGAAEAIREANAVLDGVGGESVEE